MNYIWTTYHDFRKDYYVLQTLITPFLAATIDEETDSRNCRVRVHLLHGSFQVEDVLRGNAPSDCRLAPGDDLLSLCANPTLLLDSGHHHATVLRAIASVERHAPEFWVKELLELADVEMDSANRTIENFDLAKTILSKELEKLPNTEAVDQEIPF